MAMSSAHVFGHRPPWKRVFTTPLLLLLREDGWMDVECELWTRHFCFYFLWFGFPTVRTTAIYTCIHPCKTFFLPPVVGIIHMLLEP